MELALKFWFPFDPFSSIGFPIAAFWMDFIIWDSIVFLVGSDALLYALITVLAMEFDTLKIDLVNLNSILTHDRTNRIRCLIDHHNELLDIGEKLQKIYSVTMLVSCAVSSILMCLIAFQITIAEAQISIYVVYIPYMMGMGGQVFLLCYFGQMLIDASASVADGAYICGWENFESCSFNKQLVLIMSRSQQVMRLTAMDFADISLTTFSTVCIKIDYLSSSKTLN